MSLKNCPIVLSARSPMQMMCTLSVGPGLKLKLKSWGSHRASWWVGTAYQINVTDLHANCTRKLPLTRPLRPLNLARAESDTDYQTDSLLARIPVGVRVKVSESKCKYVATRRLHITQAHASEYNSIQRSAPGSHPANEVEA